MRVGYKTRKRDALDERKKKEFIILANECLHHLQDPPIYFFFLRKHKFFIRVDFLKREDTSFSICARWKERGEKNEEVEEAWLYGNDVSLRIKQGYITISLERRMTRRRQLLRLRDADRLKALSENGDQSDVFRLIGTRRIEDVEALDVRDVAAGGIEPGETDAFHYTPQDETLVQRHTDSQVSLQQRNS